MSHPHPPTTPLARSKTAALSRVLDSVPKGYAFYTAGECPAGKLEKLLKKFHERYGIGCSPAQRVTRKQKGLANALLVLYQAPTKVSEQMLEITPGQASEEVPDQVPDSASTEMPEAPSFSWLLLATQGAGPVHEQEQLRSVLEKPRLVWLGYELRRHAVRGRTSWTWCRTKQQMADWYAYLGEQLGRQKMPAVATTLGTICRQPGFAGVREQSWALCQFARRRGYPEELPTLYFVQKLSHGERLVIRGPHGKGDGAPRDVLLDTESVPNITSASLLKQRQPGVEARNGAALSRYRVTSGCCVVWCVCLRATGRGEPQGSPVLHWSSNLRFGRPPCLEAGWRYQRYWSHLHATSLRCEYRAMPLGHTSHIPYPDRPTPQARKSLSGASLDGRGRHAETRPSHHSRKCQFQDQAQQTDSNRWPSASSLEPLHGLSCRVQPLLSHGHAHLCP